MLAYVQCKVHRLIGWACKQELEARCNRRSQYDSQTVGTGKPIPPLPPKYFHEQVGISLGEMIYLLALET